MPMTLQLLVGSLPGLLSRPRGWPGTEVFTEDKWSWTTHRPTSHLLLGSDLSCAAHVKYMLAKTRPKIHYLSVAIRASLPCDVLIQIYLSSIHTIPERASPVQGGLSQGLSKEPERYNGCSNEWMLSIFFFSRSCKVLSCGIINYCAMFWCLINILTILMLLKLPGSDFLVPLVPETTHSQQHVSLIIRVCSSISSGVFRVKCISMQTWSCWQC